METVQKIKEELKVNTELTNLLDVLKEMASSEFRILEKKKRRFAVFLEAFEGFFQMIDFNFVDHPFAQNKTGRLGIIMVTSDEGFMGGLNMRVMNMALTYPGAEAAELITIGERGAAYLRGLGRNFIQFPGIAKEERYEAALQIKDFIMKEGLAGKFSRLVLIYPKPVTFTVQQVEVLTILPCSEFLKKHEKSLERGEEVIIESPVNRIIEYLLETWITEKLFEVFEDSKLSEFSARTVHLDESHQVLLQRGRSIEFRYFRSHHELIDKGTRETFSAQLIRKKVSK